MTNAKQLSLIATLSAFALHIHGQGPEIKLQPLVPDSTMLFFAPAVEWKCAPPDGGLRPLQDADFATVERCECHRVQYEKALDAWNRYYQKQTTRELRATLTRTSTTTFIYAEVDRADSTLVTRLIPMVFDPTRVIRTDTTYASPLFAMPDSVVVFRITKFIELKAK